MVISLKQSSKVVTVLTALSATVKVAYTVRFMPVSMAANGLIPVSIHSLLAGTKVFGAANLYRGVGRSLLGGSGVSGWLGVGGTSGRLLPLQSAASAL